MGTIGTYKFGWKKKLHENIVPKRIHAENVMSESFPRTDKPWRLMVLLNLQELINPGPRVCCICSRSHQCQTVDCVSQTTSKSVAADFCKDYKIMYMPVERKDPLSDFPKKKLPRSHQDISMTLRFWVNGLKAAAPTGSCVISGCASQLLEWICCVNSYLPLIITSWFYH